MTSESYKNTNDDSIGLITGKITTTRFQFKITGKINKRDYVEVEHDVDGKTLCQVIEIERTKDKSIAKCIVIGFMDENGKVSSLRSPFAPQDKVFVASDSLIKNIIHLDEKKSRSAFIGNLDGKDIPVYLNLNKILTRHLCVLAKSGSGKSYSVGVLLEEIIDKKVPIIVIDPHGEYSTLKLANDNAKEKEIMKQFGIKAKGYGNAIKEYGDINVNKNLKPLKLSNNLTKDELMHMLPAKLNNNQKGVLYGVLKNMNSIDFDSLILELEMEESQSKWNIINIIDYIRKLDLFSYAPTQLGELVRSGTLSILNFRGISPDVQEIIVYKLLTDLFMARKKEEIPPFFLVIEEAHNFCPERVFKETKCSNIIRTIASEGRKFGLGMCVVSQRPARVDKSVISQCSTQIILKVTNPNDLKAISNSVEGTTAETEDEIKNLSIGTALVTGIVDMPLFVNIRPRKTKHGGAEIDMLEILDEKKDVVKEIKDFDKKGILPIIKPKTTLKDLELISEHPIIKARTRLIPAVVLNCIKNDIRFDILVSRMDGALITDIEKLESRYIPELKSASMDELAILRSLFKKGAMTLEELSVELNIQINLLKETITKLTKKDLIKNNTTQLSLNEKYIFDSLSNHAFYDKIEFVAVDYDLKQKPRYSENSIKKMISDFTTVENSKECYIVNYELEYAK